MSIWCDRLVTGGLLFLICFTPLAFGSVHPWAFSLMETVIFLLMIAWAARLLFSRPPHCKPQALVPITKSQFILLPLALFIGLILFQLLPLPPPLLRLLSPATYELCAKSLPGWPERAPYEAPFPAVSSPQGGDGWTVLPTVEEVRQGAPVPFSTAPSVELSSPPAGAISGLRLWRPLSIAPSLTWTDLLKLLAYVALFLLVRFYPFGHYRSAEAEERFFRAVLLTVLCTGLLVAFVGLMQRFTWNGRILWVFVPYDWGMAVPGTAPHASGPFVSYTHFANYLTLIFPLALVSTLFPTFLTLRDTRWAFRLLCGFASFLLLAGILLSMSRGGWVGLVSGVGLLVWMLRSLPKVNSLLLWRGSRGSRARWFLAGFALLLAVGLFFAGPVGRRQIDARLEETVMGEPSGQTRVLVWADTLSMIHDFPLWGVGLGAWPELFPRYQRPQWPAPFFREAHNDYLQLTAETGLIGLVLLTWFFLQTGAQLSCGVRTIPAKALPVFAALLTALGVMTFHEFFDFNLQIPANAFLFTLLFGTALRLTDWGLRKDGHRVPASYVVSMEGSFSGRTIPWSWPQITLGMGAVASCLLILALHQDNLPYPYNIPKPASEAEAKALLLSHPARASLHLALARLSSPVPLSQRQRELGIALWLEPKNTPARDLYAAGLLRQGQQEEGLRQITLSIFFAPSLSAHSYLNSRLIPRLPPREQKAIEEGFRQAVASGGQEAVIGLGTFYAGLGRFADEGKLYEEAALRERTLARRPSFLLEGGQAYARAGDGEKAEELLRQAVASAPQNAEAYRYLTILVFAPRNDLESAKTIIAAGIQNGADPFSLLLALAEAAQTVGDLEEAKAALLQALRFQPASFDIYSRLGLLYLQEQNFERAALVWRKAIELNPKAALAFYCLGMAEEGRYRLFEAEQAYAHALALDPENTDFRRRYEAFQRKLTAGS